MVSLALSANVFGPNPTEAPVLEVTMQDILDARAACGEPPICGVPLQAAPHDSVDTNKMLLLDEQLVIGQTRAGNFNSFNMLVLKYQRLAYSVAFRMLHSRETAADAVQESFLKAFRAMPSFRGGSFKCWLLRIVTNTCYDTLRQDRELFDTPLGDDEDFDDGCTSYYDPIASEESPQAFVERMELRARIELGIRMLPCEQRLVIVLHDVHGLSYDEISEITGSAMGTVKSRISRARLKLRTFLLDKPELLPISRWQHS